MTTERIVVGVDASTPASRALRWAIAEARLRAASVEAVHVWRYPVLTYAPVVVPSPMFARGDLEAEAGAVLDDVVARALAGDPHPPPIERVVLEGAPAARLLERAAGALLLVVGHRGRGGFADLVLGSVAQQCATHAPCPVVVVR